MLLGEVGHDVTALTMESMLKHFQIQFLCQSKKGRTATKVLIWHENLHRVNRANTHTASEASDLRPSDTSHHPD